MTYYQIAAAECKNPRRNVPKAIKRVFFRILVFYLGGVFIIGLLVPSNNPLLNLDSSNAAASPFVIAFSEAGIKVLPSVSWRSELSLLARNDTFHFRLSMLPF